MALVVMQCDALLSFLQPTSLSSLSFAGGKRSSLVFSRVEDDELFTDIDKAVNG